MTDAAENPAAYIAERAKPEPVPLTIIGDTATSSGVYLHLNDGASVKIRALPGLQAYVCVRCRANQCAHVDHVRAHEGEYAASILEAIEQRCAEGAA